MKKFLALFAAATLCAGAQEAPVAATTAAAPDLVLRVKSLDALREAITAATTLVGQPQAGLMATMALSTGLNEAGLADFRPADPVCAWVWDFNGMIANGGDEPPPFLVALPVATPSEDVLDEALDRVESDDASAPKVWSIDDEVFVTVRGKHTLAASSLELFDRAEALLAAPAALPEATFSFSSDTLQTWVPQLLDLVLAEQQGDIANAIPGDAPAWIRAFLDANLEMQRYNIEEAKQFASFRAGFRCDLSNGLTLAGGATAAPGTPAAEAFAKARAPLAADALAGIPAGSFLWLAAADLSDLPNQNAKTAKAVEILRKYLLPLISDEARRARVDALVGTLVDSALAAGRGATTVFFRTDDEGRFYGKSVSRVASADKARATYRAMADFLRAEFAACTNAPGVADIAEDGLSVTVHSRPLVAAIAAVAPGVAAAIETADGGDAEETKAEVAAAISDSMKKAAAEGVVAFLGEDFAQTVTFAGDVETCVVGAVGATASDRPAIKPDLSAEALYFPGQTRLAVLGIDFAGAIRDLAPTAAKAAAAMKKICQEEAEKADAKDATPDFPVAEVVQRLAIAADGAPLIATVGMKDGEYTQTWIVSPAFLRFVASVAELGTPSFSGMDDDDIWEDDDDVDFDDDEVDERDENTYPNPDPAELEDEDFDDDEF